jgi:hypothetical protein
MVTRFPDKFLPVWRYIVDFLVTVQTNQLAHDANKIGIETF